MSDQASPYNIFSPEELVEEFKKNIFQRYNISLAADDPLFIEIEMLAMLAENQRNNFNAILQAYETSIIGLQKKWDEKETQALNNYEKKTESLINTLKASCHNIFQDAMMEAIVKAQKSVDAKWAEKILEKQEEKFSFFKSLLYMCFGLNTAVLCILLFLTVRTL